MTPAAARLTLNQLSLMDKESSSSAWGWICQHRNTPRRHIGKSTQNPVITYKNILRDFCTATESYPNPSRMIKLQQQKQATSKKQEQQKTLHQHVVHINATDKY